MQRPSLCHHTISLVKFDRLPQRECLILPSNWGRQEINPDDGEMVIRVEIHAVPLIAAWAITSHRCQGTTIADIPITINADCMQFCEGSFYVAVSRCKAFEQLSIINYKGYCQSKIAYGFYQGFLTLPPPRQYQPANNLETLNERLPTSERTPSDPVSSPVPSRPLSNPVSPLVLSCPLVVPQFPTVTDMKENWETHILPQLREFQTHCSAVDSDKNELLKLVQDWMGEWVPNHSTTAGSRKHPKPSTTHPTKPPVTQPTLHSFMKKMEDDEFVK